MNRNDKIGIVSCSNGQLLSYRNKLEKLDARIKDLGLIPVWGNYIYELENGINGSPKAKAKELMQLFQDENVKAIFDISGGDIANEILPYLDYKIISGTKTKFYGYSDLTTIINAIYAKTNKSSVLYQIRNLIQSDSDNQVKYFKNSILGNEFDLYNFSYSFIQQSEMRGVVVGGNIRCLLKLAGTEYWPDMHDKILFLESYGGLVPQMITYLSQLKQMNVFDQVTGVLLGTFTKMQKAKYRPTIQELLKNYVTDDLPIAFTNEIGHGSDSKAMIIGKEYHLTTNT
ncbi:MAG: LD-carboxypeptidase [Bacillota bacterium]|nr:LD-carboxypeptidase [Bacillota bacterium]